MKNILLITILLSSKILLSKSNYSIKIVINSKCSQEQFIQIDELINKTKTLKNIKFKSLTIERSDIGLSEIFNQKDTFDFSDPIFTIGDNIRLDSLELNKQFQNYYLKNKSITDKIFLFSNNDDITNRIINHVNNNKAKSHKMYNFTIFINTALKRLPCPKTIDIVQKGEYIQRCEQFNNAYFIFKWKCSSEYEVSKFKFNLIHEGKNIFQDSFNYKIINFYKKGDSYYYYLNNDYVEYLIPKFIGNLTYYDAPFKWYVEAIYNNSLSTKSEISYPIHFLKCPSKDEALPCDE